MNEYNSNLNMKSNSKKIKIESSKEQIKGDIKILNKKIKSCKTLDKEAEFNLKHKDKSKENTSLKFECSIDLIEDAYSFLSENTFCVFKSINNIFYLIYTDKKKSIISYNIMNYKKLHEIKNAHNKNISNFRNIFDKANNRDLVISVSAEDNNIKLWNINNLECLHSFENINQIGYLYSACFMKDNNNIYIISSNWNSSYNNTEPIKIFDLNGNQIKIINNSHDKIFFIDSFYDSNYAKNYIITGNIGYIKSYDYTDNRIYHKYKEKDNNNHTNIIFNKKEGIIELIELIEWGNHIKIWNFHSGELIKKINANNQLYGFCLLNNNYLSYGNIDNTIRLLDLNKEEKILKLVGHNNSVLSIKKIDHPKYGECLISQGEDNKIKMWINNN